VSHFEICLKKNIFKIFFDPFLGIFFSTLSSAKTIEVIGLFFFYELALKNWAMNIHFNPIPIISGFF